MTAKKTNPPEYPSSGQIAAGLMIIPIALFMLLSLMSFDWRDISTLSAPPNQPVNNLMGPFGAWLAYLFLSLSGVGAFMLPVWMMILGSLMIFYRGNFRPKAAWAAACLVFLAAVMDLHGAFQIRANFNLTDNGGILGWLITHGLLIRWLSPVGAGIILWSMFLLTLVMAIGPANIATAYHYTAIGCGLLLDYLQHKHAHLMDRDLELEKEERRLKREQARLEREVRRKAIAERFKQKPGQSVTHKTPAIAEPEPEIPEPDQSDEPDSSRETKRRVKSVKRHRVKRSAPEPEDVDSEPQEPLPPPLIDPDKAQFPGYQLPPMSLLNPSADSGKDGHHNTAATAELLVETLNEFGISAEISSVKQGPVVTRYEVLPAKGVRVERIAALANNLALSLKAHSLRVQAPVPGKGVVGIEVPNDTAKMVVIRDIIESDEWRAGTARLPLCLGKDVGGKNVVADLAKMPHLLVAGATGAGKSVCINAMLSGLFMCKSPDELRLILVDPKIVEFSIYNDLPHLVVPVITDPKKVALSLRWAINEMESRYKMFAKVKVRNIESFNNRHRNLQQDFFDENSDAQPQKSTDDAPPSVPYIVIVIDELADLMLAAGAEIENSIARLAQLSRAVGIHMIIATQRPSVNVITGTIKANFPARIAFQVAQKVDSRTILDQSGADKLLGRGDMLYLPPASSKLIRAQGAMITDEEVDRIVTFMKEQAQPSFEMEIKSKLDKPAAAPDSLDDGEDDDIVEQAIEIIRETQRASTSSLQRRLRIGYTRAARVIDILEERGIVGPPCGSGPREILIDLDVNMENNPDDGGDDDEEIIEKEV